MKTTMRKGSSLRPSTAATLLALGSGLLMASAARAQETTTVEPWKVDVYYENDTHYRGKDNTGNTVGLSKFRNTLQVEADKKFGSGWGFHGILRGSWDGVYQLNKDEFGKDAGGPITLQSTVGGNQVPESYAGTSILAGGTIVNYNTVAGVFGLTGNKFLNSPDLLAINPNEGLRVLRRPLAQHQGRGGLCGAGAPVRQGQPRLPRLRRLRRPEPERTAVPRVQQVLRLHPRSLRQEHHRTGRQQNRLHQGRQAAGGVGPYRPVPRARRDQPGRLLAQQHLRRAPGHPHSAVDPADRVPHGRLRPVAGA